jgi:transposase InsO family protein
MIPPKRDETTSDIRFIPLEARSACALAGVWSHVPINKRARQSANVCFPCQVRRISDFFMIEARSNAISFPGFRTETEYLVEKCDSSALSVLLGWAVALTNSTEVWVKAEINGIRSRVQPSSLVV